MLEQAHMLQPGPLRELRVELLRNCPLRCVHCSAFASAGHPWLLPPDRVLRLMDEFVELGGRRISLTGGEPFMYPALDRLLRHCGSKELEVRLFSSGAVLERGQLGAVRPEKLQVLAPFIASVAFSLYSVTDSIHDSVTRVAGSLGVTVEAIRHTVEAGILAEIHFVPTRLNYRELVAVAELAASLGARRLGILRFVPHGRGAIRADDLELDRPAHLYLRDMIADLRARHPGVFIQVGSAFNALGVGDPTPCTAAIDQMVVAADGRVAPCSAFENVRIDDAVGNILLHPLRSVWRDSALLKQVRHALHGTNNCSGCLAQKLIASGRLNASIPDPLEVQMGYPSHKHSPDSTYIDGR